MPTWFPRTPLHAAISCCFLQLAQQGPDRGGWANRDCRQSVSLLWSAGVRLIVVEPLPTSSWREPSVSSADPCCSAGSLARAPPIRRIRLCTASLWNLVQCRHLPWGRAEINRIGQICWGGSRTKLHMLQSQNTCVYSIYQGHRGIGHGCARDRWTDAHSQ